jgi:DNA-binding CsgD family transcriptional regulator
MCGEGEGRRVDGMVRRPNEPLCMAFDAHEGVLHTGLGETSDGDARRAVWHALASGDYRVVLEHRVYLFVEPSRPRPRLTPIEKAVVHAAARALPGKEIAYTLGIAPSTVSTALSSATTKTGLSSATELARLVRALVVEPLDASDRSLSEAEREVLELVLAGKSNSEIAELRKRSVRTIANQVASILRKTGSPSRHVLRVTSNR